MRLSREAWRQLKPLFAAGTGLEFDYHGRHRVGILDSVGEGPQGAFFTLRQPDGDYKSYSLAKVQNLRVGRFLPWPARAEARQDAGGRREADARGDAGAYGADPYDAAGVPDEFVGRW